MEDDSRKSLKIWLYFIPIFILAAYPALKYVKKAGSGDVSLTKEDYSAFNAEQGEINKPPKKNLPQPVLNEGEFRIHYKNAAEQEAIENAAQREAEARAAAAARAKAEAGRPKTAQQGGTGEYAPDSMKANEHRSVGMTKGLLGYAIGKVINNPKAVGALLNNEYVIGGFMARDTVKNATSSPEALAKYLSNGSVISNFMNNSSVQAAMNNPDVLNAAAGSGFVKAMLNTPAGQALVNNPQAMADIIAANPQLQGLMTDPKIMGLLMSNPGAAGYITQMNSGK